VVCPTTPLGEKRTIQLFDPTPVTFTLPKFVSRTLALNEMLAPAVTDVAVTALLAVTFAGVVKVLALVMVGPTPGNTVTVTVLVVKANTLLAITVMFVDPTTTFGLNTNTQFVPLPLMLTVP
jgi:hypothetical protein